MILFFWKTLRFLLAAVTAGFVGRRLIFAYIDPNTGGMLFQFLAVLFAFFTGMMLFLSRYIRIAIAKTRRLLRGTSGDATEGVSPGGAAEDR
jgi:hypothetical protein